MFMRHMHRRDRGFENDHEGRFGGERGAGRGGWAGWPGFWHERHGGWGGGRMFGQGDLRFVILSLIADRPRHGYDIIKALEERSGGLYAPSPGAVYPILTLLEDQGFATAAAEEGGKKLYTVTDEGRVALAANQAMIDGIFARIDLMAQAGGAAATTVELHQAIQLLRQALALRHGRAP